MSYYLIAFLLLSVPLLRDEAPASESRVQEMHDFHISRCEINWDAATGDLQIAAHIFIDDLEEALRRKGIVGLRIGTPTEKDNAEEAIMQYLTQTILITHGKRRLIATLIGKELSDDKMAIWCYLEIPAQKNLHQLTIENSLLTEVFPDQKNIVDFTISGKRKEFIIFDSRTRNATFTF